MTNRLALHNALTKSLWLRAQRGSANGSRTCWPVVSSGLRWPIHGEKPVIGDPDGPFWFPMAATKLQPDEAPSADTWHFLKPLAAAARHGSFRPVSRHSEPWVSSV